MIELLNFIIANSNTINVVVVALLALSEYLPTTTRVKANNVISFVINVLKPIFEVIKKNIKK